MQEFNYTVTNKEGTYHKGLIQAVNSRQAANILHERGFTVISIVEKKKGFNVEIFGGIGIGDQAQFTRQLATMITSGLPLAESLEVLQKQTENKKLKEIIASISEDIQGGGSFSDSLSKHSEVFSAAYINVIKAGEASGTLDKVLLKLSETLEKEREFQGKIKGAMVYPLIITVAMLLVAAIILIFVIPKLGQVYQDLDIVLPLPTRILIWVSGFMVKFWWLVIIAIVGGIFAFRRYRKTPEGALVVDRLIMRLPVFGKLNRDTSLTEFTRTLGALVAAGVPILEALKIAGETATNAVHRQAVSAIVAKVEKGASLSTAITSEDAFPPLIPQMTAVGEETGKMDEVLTKVSIFFEMEVEQEVKNLTTALEPIIMMVLGVMVGLLMVSIILPIYSITSAF
ncbi:MAG: type II secretion system F family protein [Candidatus Woykebacteria bacterium]